MSTVLITGATGFIGRSLCAKMLGKGWKVKGTFRVNDDSHMLPAGVEGVKVGSIEDFNNVFSGLGRVDAVVHLAGRAHVMSDSSADELELFRKINVSGTDILARAAAKAGVTKFIFISSLKANGEESPLLYTEKDIPAPKDPYGMSKYEAEIALKKISAETGLKIVILRPPLVYGPGVKANFKELIKMVQIGVPLPLKGVHNIRSLIYLENLTDVIFTCMVDPKAIGETFMVSDGRDISTPDLIRMIADAMHKKAIMFSAPKFILRALAKISGKERELRRLTGSLYVSTEKIKRLLGWKPPFTLKEGIENTVRSYKLS